MTAGVLGLVQGFAHGLPDVYKRQARDVFLRRYWAAQPVGEIAAAYGVSENKVSVTLLRTRRRLLQQLEQEGML